MPPRATRPVGVALVDKPAGPSSFALVEELRRRTGARTGHAGTLDPFATGLLVLLSGAATRLAPCFVGLDKRYETEVDLAATTSTGDPEGDVLERHEPPTREELERRLDGLRGEVELRIPAASAVKVGGERAYRLARRGESVEMPMRRSHVHELELVAYDGAVATLGLHVGSGTYVRSIAEALGGHCTSLRRTEVGPFTVAEADPERLHPAAEMLARLPAEALARVPEDVRRRVLELEAGEAVRVKVVRSPEDLDRRPRAVAIGTFDGVHRGHLAVLRAAVESGLTATAVTFHPHPREVLGNQVSLLATLERRLELLAEAGVEETLVVEFTLETAQLEPEAFARTHLEAIGAELVVAGEAFRFGHKRRGDLALLERLGIATTVVPLVPGISSSRIRQLVAEGDVRAAAPLLGRPVEVEGTVVSGDARGGTLGFPTANLRAEPALLVPAFGIYAGSAGAHRAAVSIGVNPHYGGAERRIEAFVLDFEGDLYGQRLVIELWERLRDEAAFDSERALVDQIARDVEGTRAATPPPLDAEISP